MPGTKIYLTGDSEVALELESALRRHGLEPEILAAPDMPAALVGMEASIEAERPRAAVSVGTGDDSLALAITASKLGIPLAACLDETRATGDGRILATLAALHTDSDPERAADVIVSWLSQDADGET